jgi:hypothetical protein
MSVTTQLKAIVDQAARSGALTPEAIRQFDDLQKRSTELEASLEARTKERDEARSVRDAKAQSLTETQQKLAEAIKRAEVAESTNTAAQKAIWVAQFEAERRNEMRSILSDVFRNAEIQRTISHSQPMVIPPTYQGGVSTIQYSQDTKTETETRK